MSVTFDPAAAGQSSTVDEFCELERMSRAMLYKAWREGWGPEFYLNGSHRRITQRARQNWQREREAAAKATS